MTSSSRSRAERARLSISRLFHRSTSSESQALDFDETPSDRPDDKTDQPVEYFPDQLGSISPWLCATCGQNLESMLLQLVSDQKPCYESRRIAQLLATLRKAETEDFRQFFCLICIRLAIEVKKYVRDVRLIRSGSCLWRYTRGAGFATVDITMDLDGHRVTQQHLQIQIRIDENRSKATIPPQSDYFLPLIDQFPTRLELHDQECRWLETCVTGEQDHRFCADVMDEVRLWRPDRLLEIDELGNRVTLRAGSAMPSYVTYATLSHCWGQPGGKLLLTTRNMKQLQLGINKALLAKTFQDAITVARRLGFNYLWIDSLCIIQDSRADWQVQSVKMGDIYHHSDLNIAVLDAKDDDEGFLGYRDNRLRYGFTLPLDSFPSNIRDLWLERRNRMTSNLAAPHENPILEFSWISYNDQILNYHLLTRAWVTQERELARRTLLFDSFTVKWACEAEQHAGLHPHSDFDWWQAIRKAQNSPSASPVVHWYSFINIYSATSLTKATDRLIAVSAIAANFARLMECEYVAGFWLFDLYRQLTWFRARDPYGSTSVQAQMEWFAACPNPPSAEYIAPSWSWAAVNGIKYIPDLTFEIGFVEFVDCTAEPVVPNFQYGQVKGGFLQIKGQLFTCHSFKRGHDGCKIRLNSPDIELEFIPDHSSFLSEGNERSYPHLYCLPIALSQRNYTLLHLQCLILERVQNRWFNRPEALKMTFRRVGFARVVILHDNDLKNHPLFKSIFDFSEGAGKYGLAKADMWRSAQASGRKTVISLKADLAGSKRTLTTLTII